ncbi:MAG: RNA polymerase sigma factor [Candidatus Buchananbacteria bacterium]|nr:RNA polymerase sigma factor [Candidatus Buchananbacteria bacterium]
MKVKNQDPEAFGKFYDLYVTRIYRFVFFKINSVSDAQDITSEVFLKLWQYVKAGKDIRNLNALTYMIARNMVIDFYRRNNKLDDPISDEHFNIPDEQKDILRQQIMDSELNDVLKGIENLKDEYKEAIILKYLDELSISEIAKILNKSNGAVRVLLYRATKALKENINDQ